MKNAETLADIGSIVERFVHAADNLVNALLTAEASEPAAKDRLHARREEAMAEYDAARLALVGDADAGEPEDDANLL